MRPRSPLNLLAMVAVVTVLAVSSLVSYQQHAQTSRIAATAVKTDAWTASELEMELLKFDKALLLAGLEQTTLDELLLRFELLWSRIEVVRTGSETLAVRQLPGATALIEELHQLVVEMEPRLLTLQPGDEAGALALARLLQPFGDRVRALNVRSYMGPEAREKVVRTFEQRHTFNLSMAGLLFSGTLLVFLLFRESRHNLHQSLHDALTSLPNRKCFNERLSQAEANSRQAGTKLGILVIDLDNFKEINDTLGHHCGDQLLMIVAQRLRSCVRTGETVARLGGDEFGVIQEGIGSAEACTHLARRICDHLGTETSLNGHRVYPGASIGVSVYPDDGAGVSQVLASADLAMYRAKGDPGASYRVFEPQMNSIMQRRKRLSDDLRQALRNDTLALNYQPIVHLENGTIVAVESLLRWHHPHYGYVPPPEVVEVAEQSGLARELNEWVIRRACEQHQRWAAEGLGTITVAVNVSPAMFTQHDIVDSLTRILAETSMPAAHLTVEVTEDTTMRDIEASPDAMRRMKQLGVTIALDDFGTGYSSLSHLKRLPIDKLKIDRSFVQDLNNLPKDLRFVRSIISLARSLDIELIAEGIELQSNLEDLRREGCQLGQGYLFSRAVPSGEISDMLRNQCRGGAALACANFQGITCRARKKIS